MRLLAWRPHNISLLVFDVLKHHHTLLDLLTRDWRDRCGQINLSLTETRFSDVHAPHVMGTVITAAAYAGGRTGLPNLVRGHAEPNNT